MLINFWPIHKIFNRHMDIIVHFKEAVTKHPTSIQNGITGRSSKLSQSLLQFYWFEIHGKLANLPFILPALRFCPLFHIQLPDSQLVPGHWSWTKSAASLLCMVSVMSLIFWSSSSILPNCSMAVLRFCFCRYNSLLVTSSVVETDIRLQHTNLLFLQIIIIFPDSTLREFYSVIPDW